MEQKQNNFKTIPMSNLAAKQDGGKITPTESYVGYGYNVLNSTYINPLNVQINYPVFDVNDENFKKLIVSKQSLTSTNIQESGSDIVELMEALSLKISAGAKTLLFSGQIDSEFSTSASSVSEYTYSKHVYVSIRERHAFENGAQYKQFITPAFKKDLEGSEKLSAGKLFERYGTHIISDICRGGRLDVNFTYQRDCHETKTNINASVEAAYKAFTTKVSSEYDKQTKEVIERSKITVKAVGGESTKLFEPDTFKATFDSWVASLSDKENWEICHLPDNKEALVPIWEFCSDEARKQELENEFKKEFDTIEAEYSKWQTYVTDIYIASDKDKDAAQGKCPVGYTIVGNDLNRGARGNYIYLCCKVGAKENAITCMFNEIHNSGRGEETRNVDHMGHNASFTRLGSDLNAGAGGDFIYTNYTRSTAFSPIKRLTTVLDNDRGEEHWEFVCWENTANKADCNKSVGGAFIYIIAER